MISNNIFILIILILVILRLLIQHQNRFKFVRNYKKEQDYNKNYNIESFFTETQRVFKDNITGERYFRISFYEWEENKKSFLDREFYVRKLIFNDYIITNIEIYDTQIKYLKEYRVYYKFLDIQEAKHILVNNLGTLSINTQYINQETINYINKVIEDVKSDNLTSGNIPEIISMLEKITTLPANLVTLISTIIQLILFLYRP
ncbi:MAG: hypothetical protein SO424_01935 [[Pasteurella] aerogenes]|nr:hypothetical protein [[Pasteurella] aerogenes]